MQYCQTYLLPPISISHLPHLAAFTHSLNSPSLSLSLKSTGNNMHPGTSVAAVVCAASVLLISNGCLSMAMVEDKITALPGQPPVSFAQYSGYVEVDAVRKRSLFYYFAEAELDPATKPLVLWLNGGPGCSSVGVGAFSENGPFRPSGNALMSNEYSWNKEANMLYLESPAGVGFSYSTDPSFYGGVGDSMTEARDNLRFLEGWFAKFPQYKGRNLYIAGESYAGHYVPQLAQRMVEFDDKEKLFNLKGIALGNPVLEFSTDFNSRAEFFWSHGLISDSTYNIFTTVCNYSRYVSEYYHGSISSVCDRVMSQVTKETSRFVDKYDVTLDVCISSVLMQSQVLTPSPNSTEQLNRALDVCVED
uniref:Carboxypeptidase n=1 Tax=Aegilops tauschii subsp. strangulata TaxID=200361 RepID=A0A453BVW5_AEGTS